MELVDVLEAGLDLLTEIQRTGVPVEVFLTDHWFTARDHPNDHRPRSALTRRRRVSRDTSSPGSTSRGLKRLPREATVGCVGDSDVFAFAEYHAAMALAAKPGDAGFDLLPAASPSGRWRTASGPPASPSRDSMTS